MTQEKYSVEVRKCDNCNNSEFKTVLSNTEGFKVLKCNNCGLCFTSPLLPQELMIEEYAKEHSNKITSETYLKEYLLPVENQKEEVINRLELNSGGNVLDVGCGVGEFLERMKNRGFKTVGIDSSELSVDVAVKRGLKVILGEIDEVLEKDNFIKNTKFDLITLWHALEHFYSPTSILLKLNRLLKDNGLLIIAVPNFGSIQSWLFKEDWFGLRIPHHLYHFTPTSLSLLCNKTGFKVIDCFPSLPVHAYGCLNISAVTKIKHHKKKSNYLGYLFFRSLITLAPFFIFIENRLGRMASMCLIAKK